MPVELKKRGKRLPSVGTRMSWETTDGKFRIAKSEIPELPTVWYAERFTKDGWQAVGKHRYRTRNAALKAIESEL